MYPVSIALRDQVLFFHQFTCSPFTLFLLLCGIRFAAFSNLHAPHVPCFYCFAGSGALLSAIFMHSMDPVSIALRDQVRCFQQFSCTPWTLFLLLCGISCAALSDFDALD